MSRILLEPAWLLSVRPYRETSALVEAFTAAHGRVGLVARAARVRAPLRAALQPFTPLLLSWSDRGELGTLTAAEAAGAPVLLRGEAIFAGWYLNELLLRLLQRRDAHAALFEPYARTLAALAGPAAAAALRLFEKQLLAALGYGLEIPESLDAAGWYAYDGDGGVRVAEPGPRSYSGASLRALAHGRLETAESLRDARRLLQQALAPHLGERALKTPEMLRTLRAAARRQRA